MAQKFDLILKEKISLSSTTDHLVFDYAGEEPLDYVAGQFLSLHFTRDGKDVRRNYSIANNPCENNNTLEIAIAYVENGLASTAVQNLNPGDKLAASGPYGIFTLKDDNVKRYIFMGTGTGITPYRSMLPDLSKLLGTSDLQVVLLQGVRTADDLLYGEEFLAFAKQHPNFEFRACFSRQEPNSDNSHEYHGYIQDQLQNLNIKPGDDIAYLCGNPAMVDAAFTSLQDLGLDRKAIRREKYIHQK